jgi:chemotaxis protein MotD
MTAAIADRSVPLPTPGASTQRGKTAEAQSRNDGKSGADSDFRNLLSRMSDETGDAAAPPEQGQPGKQNGSSATGAVQQTPDTWLPSMNPDEAASDGEPSLDDETLGKSASESQPVTFLPDTLAMIGAALGLIQKTSPEASTHAGQTTAASGQRFVMTLDEALRRLGPSNGVSAVQNADGVAMPGATTPGTVAADGAPEASETVLAVTRKESHHAPSASTDPSTPQSLTRTSVASSAGSDVGQGEQQPEGEGHLPASGVARTTARNADEPVAPLNFATDTDAASQGNVSSPAKQISDAIVKELPRSNPVSGTSAPAPTSAPLTSKASTLGEVKVIQIQLQPADLGTVSVRISLKGNTLDVQLEVSHGGTANLVAKHRDALENMLKSAGYTPDHISIQVADVDKSSTFAQSNQNSGHSQSQGSSPGNSGWSQPNGRSSGQQEHEARRGDRAGYFERSDRADAPLPGAENARPSTGAVYL